MSISKIKKKIINCFDRSSENYESNAMIQKSVCRELVKFYVDSKLCDFNRPIRALDLGSGTGLLSSKIQEIWFLEIKFRLFYYKILASMTLLKLLHSVLFMKS